MTVEAISLVLAKGADVAATEHESSFIGEGTRPWF